MKSRAQLPWLDNLLHKTGTRSRIELAALVYGTRQSQSHDLRPSRGTVALTV